ncbi:hypothetical protein SCHPADRAFT_893092 [Schizopora paradoxa]|uniref:Uncharacterized protein n=1 Tax=Schizopora paradoxa TaxID=27342 RepID=A0A0H2RCD5_9AGAM|nr:hypothetical protein SCHPADRAFT_893092 [Schizopora paradoxa]
MVLCYFSRPLNTLASPIAKRRLLGIDRREVTSSTPGRARDVRIKSSSETLVPQDRHIPTELGDAKKSKQKSDAIDLENDDRRHQVRCSNVRTPSGLRSFWREITIERLGLQDLDSKAGTMHIGASKLNGDTVQLAAKTEKHLQKGCMPFQDTLLSK